MQHLRLSAAECGGEGYLAECMSQQLSINQQMFQLQHPRQTQIYHMMQQQQQQHLQQQQAQLQAQHQNGDAAKKEAQP